MAKVTLTIEDVEKDGKKYLSVHIESDNKNMEEVTPAESVGSQLYEVIVNSGPSERIKNTSTLN